MCPEPDEQPAYRGWLRRELALIEAEIVQESVPRDKEDKTQAIIENKRILFHARNLRGYSFRNAESMDPATLLEVLKRNQRLSFVERITFFKCSEMVAYSVHNHRKKITRELLWKLTDESLCPFLSPSFEAPVMLLADSYFHHNGEPLSELQKRCITSISTYWSTCYKTLVMLSGTTTSSDVALLEFLHELPEYVLQEMIRQTQSQQKTTMDHCDVTTEDVHALAIRLFALVRSIVAMDSSTGTHKDTTVTCTSTATPSFLSLSESDSPQDMIFLDKADMEEMYLGEQQCKPPVQYIYCPKIEL